MIKNNGLLIGARHCSNIYIIVHLDYIYIGETGSHPAIRWGSHLVKNGTFRKNMRGMYDDDLIKNEDIFFASFAVPDVEIEPESNRRLARMAIETEVHRAFFLNTSALGDELFITSTCEEYPTRHRFSFDPAAIARTLFEEICARYQEWLLSLQNSYDSISVSD